MYEISYPMTWKKDFETGVGEIDEQHKILVHTLNQAHKKLAGEYDIELLSQITQDLLSYALYHFEEEEGLMQQYDYFDASDDAAEKHMAQHRHFSEHVIKVREGFKSETPIKAEDLLNFLQDWLINHILNTDMKLGAFIIEKRKA